MADLIDRLSGHDQTRPKIAVHQFTGCLRLYARGTITAAQVVQGWDLQGAELTQAQALRAQVDAQTNANTKMGYVLAVEAVAMLIEDGNDTIYHNQDGTINKTAVGAALGIS